jgi:hypothetical protein
MVYFSESRAQLEQEGVHIGGWSLRQVFTPSKDHSVGHGTSRSACFTGLLLTTLAGGAQDIRGHTLGLESDWTLQEEKALVRKLDLHIMVPCCERRVWSS